MKDWALITGASTGLGKDFCELFAKDHVNLIICSRSEDKLSALADDLKKKYPIEVTIFPTDLSQQSNVEKLVQFIKDKSVDKAKGMGTGKGIDKTKDMSLSKNENFNLTYLINNAGVGVYGSFASNEWQPQHQMIELNLVTLTHLLHQIIPLMVTHKKGKILNVASTAAFQPGPNMSVYFATKAYVLSLSEALNEELKNTGVSITTLCPGPTQTDFFKAAKMENLKYSDTKNKFMMSSLEVAQIGYQSLMNSERVVVAGFINKIAAFSTRFLPRPLLAKIAQQLLN